MLGLYLHIPFCQAICSYCNFNRGLLDVDLRRRYVDALEIEILSSRAGLSEPGDTIFFGGGTPSLLEPDEVRRLIYACRDAYALTADAEVTLETNPETATPERLAAFREAGVNRLSFGVQSFDDGELRRLGRLHSSERARIAVRDAKRTGFDSVSFDLMFWLPGQTPASWARTVDEAIALEPDHLSLYLLELYPNAPLKETMARSALAAPQRQSAPEAARGGGVPRAPKAPAAAVPSESAPAAGAGVGPRANESRTRGTAARGGGAPRAPINDNWVQAADDDAADMYLNALGQLDVAGYEQYEISNVSKPGHQSRHNLKYWQAGDWRGFGCGAHSTVAGQRWRNLASTIEYVDCLSRGEPVKIDHSALTPQGRLEEALFTGLRLSSGVDRRNILSRHGVDPWSRYGEQLLPYEAAGLLWRKADWFGLSRPGMLLANEILSTFV